jgi:hypothetical protein
LCNGAVSIIFISSLRFIAGCGVTFALPLSNRVEDAGVGPERVSVDGGGCCGDAGDGVGSRCGCRASATLPDCGDFGSGGAESPEEYEWLPLTSAVERESGDRRRGELRRGGGVGERQRRSREAKRNFEHAEPQ